MLPPRTGPKTDKGPPGLFRATLGALAGAVTGGVLGLFAVGSYPAIATRDVTYLFKFPSLSIVSCLISALLGWFLGWLIGPPLGRRFDSPKVEIAAGVVAGLIPITIIIVLIVLRS